MKTKDEILQAVKVAEEALAAAEAEREEWDALAENNKFETLEEAVDAIEDKLRSKASADCEGSYNCGLDEYTQQFIVDDVAYVGTLKVEYDRHDKTYYYVDSATFSHTLRDV